MRIEIITILKLTRYIVARVLNIFNYYLFFAKKETLFIVYILI